MDIFAELDQVLTQRKGDSPNTSYVASLHHAGLNKMLEKIGEEATEVVIAAKDAQLDANDKQALVKEVADLWFHSLVMLSALNLESTDVINELAGRFGVSGHDEKASRTS